MSGGIISGNTANFDGGGVHVSTGTFTMSGGTISGNTADRWGGGVYVDSGTFTKEDAEDDGDSGTIYGDMADASTPEDSALKNTAGAGYDGHAVYVYDASTPKKRNTTAGPSIGLDSGGTPGNWE
jgi:hypothetical protein